MSSLTHFQVDVARVFFGLPASDGFLLAGGGALLATGLTDRPTRDLDFFGAPHLVNVHTSRDQFEQAVADRGWTSTRLHDSETFVRLHVVGSEELIVDIAIDSPASRPPVISIVGPTFDPRELAGRKLVALFSRAEARDFADVFVLAQRYGKEPLLSWAQEVDQGFDKIILRDMLKTLERFTDDEMEILNADVSALRNFFSDWVRQLSA
jgi:hypothetical protein